MSARVMDQRGMTLSEIIIAVAIIGVGLVALSSAIPLGAYGVQEGSQLSTATFLANQRMEQVRNALWPDPANGKDKLGVSPSSTAAPVGTDGVTFADEQLVVDTAGVPPGVRPATAPPCTVTPVSGNGCYTRTVRIIGCDTAPGCSGVSNPDLRQVTVTVSYRPMTGTGVAPAGTAKSAVITMYIAKRP
jgi:prepilin-type N-terminal cleavage/methylation domain-containing protein